MCLFIVFCFRCAYLLSNFVSVVQLSDVPIATFGIRLANSDPHPLDSKPSIHLPLPQPPPPPLKKKRRRVKRVRKQSLRWKRRSSLKRKRKLTKVIYKSFLFNEYKNIVQWICLNELYKLMKSSFKFKLIFKILTENQIFWSTTEKYSNEQRGF